MNQWELSYLEDEWAFSNAGKIDHMDSDYIVNCLRMINDGRAKICNDGTLAKAYKERFELELYRRGYTFCQIQTLISI